MRLEAAQWGCASHLQVFALACGSINACQFVQIRRLTRARCGGRPHARTTGNNKTAPSAN